MIGKILDLDTPNANNRIYPTEVFEKALRKYKEDMVDKSRSLVFSERGMNLENTFGIVKDIFIKDGSVFVDVKPLAINPVKTGMLTEMLNDNKIHFVTGGIGSLKKNDDGVMEIQDDFELEYIFLDPEPSYIFK